MRKSPYRGLAVVVAAVAAAAIAVPLGLGSSHREAPNIALDPSADNTDVYAFTAKDAPGAPPTIGPKTFPNYQKFVDQSIRTLPGGTKTFAGERDDPFFVDLGATFDAINVRAGTGNQGQGKDDLSGYWTSATVLQIPERLVTKNGKAVSGSDSANAVVGVWSSTDRRRLQVTNARPVRH